MGESLEDSLNKKSAATEAPKEDGFQNYQELGGKLRKVNFIRVLAKAEELKASTPHPESILHPELIKQVELIAETAGIALHNEAGVDKRALIYAILRGDPVPRAPKPEPGKPGDYDNHYTRMSDQRLFGEALRVVGDTGSLDKLKETYPNITFDNVAGGIALGDSGDTKEETPPQAGIER